MKSFRAAGFNLLIWIAGFALWFLWELMIRVLLYHEQWGATQILPYLRNNLAFGLCCGLVFGILHSVLLLLFGSRKWFGAFFSPAGAVVLSVLITFMVLIPYRTYAVYHTALSFWQRWASAILIAILVYALCLMLARKFLNVLSRWSVPLKRNLFTALAALPLLVLFGSSLFQKPDPHMDAAGPIRYVVLISIDTARQDFFGAYGVRKIRTPVFDRIASEGALFQQAISSIPVTGPSHISMLTGQPPLVHGVRFNGQPLSNRIRTIPTVLREAGFQTGGFIAGYPLKVFESGLDRGFQEYDDHLVYTDLFNETFIGRLAELFPFFPRGVLRLANEVTDKAVLWLNQRDGSPFFLFLHYYDPHFPYGTKAQLRNHKNVLSITAKPQDLKQQTELYASEIEKVDEQIGRVVEVLKKKGFYDRALLIVTSDHGESLGEHQYFYTHAFHVYEQLLQVPLIIRCPDLVRAGSIVSPPVALFDIAKTILESVGLAKTIPVSGFNLIELARQVPANYNRSIVSHNFEYRVHSIRSANWKLIQNDGKDPAAFELYDLASDPMESKNLFNSEQSVTVELKRRLTGILTSPGSNQVDWTVNDLSPEQLEKLKSLGYFN